jgi:hypothetical protein
MHQQLVPLAAVLLLTASCGQGSGEGQGDAGPPLVTFDSGLPFAEDAGFCTELHCHPGLQPDAYEPGLTKSTNRNNFTVSLWSDPAPPGLGVHSLTLLVNRVATGEPAPGLRVRIIADLHDVGASEVPPQVSDVGGGQYEVTGVDILDYGLWEIVVLVQEEKVLDVASFYFAVF